LADADRLEAVATGHHLTESDRSSRSITTVGFGPAVFHWKRLTLLWRGSRDGLGVRNFHGRCEGPAPTLALIEDTKAHIFGGFTPLKWDSTNVYGKADPSLKSFCAEESTQFSSEEFCAEGRTLVWWEHWFTSVLAGQS
jgi:hypothetical protein